MSNQTNQRGKTMKFLDFAILWLIIGFLTVISSCTKDYKKYGMFSTVADILWYIVLFLSGPSYYLYRIGKIIKERILHL